MELSVVSKHQLDFLITNYTVNVLFLGSEMKVA